MERNPPSWLGLVFAFVWMLWMIWGVCTAGNIGRRYLDAISRATGYQVEWFYRSPPGVPYIYTKSSEAWRLREAYRRAYYRHAIIASGLGLGWLLFGGPLLVTLFNLVSALPSG